MTTKGKPKQVNKRVKEKPELKARRIQAVKIIAKNIGKVSIGKSMRDAGYSESYADNPQRFQSTKKFKERFLEKIPEKKIMARHETLLDAHRLDHMVFPLAIEDEDIEELLLSVNCKLRKIVHSTQSKHAYFWSPDNKAIKDALDMAHKIIGSYAPTQVEDVTDNPLRKMSDTELAKEIKDATKFFTKKD